MTHKEATLHGYLPRYSCENDFSSTLKLEEIFLPWYTFKLWLFFISYFSATCKKPFIRFNA